MCDMYRHQKLNWCTETEGKSKVANKKSQDNLIIAGNYKCYYNYRYELKYYIYWPY